MSDSESVSAGETPARPGIKRKLLIGFAFLALAAALLFAFGVKKLSFIYPDGEQKTVLALSGTRAKPPEAPAYEGYVFLGWQSLSGEYLSGDNLRVYRSESYSPVYTVELETEEHRQYLFPDENGFFLPYDTLTRGESARMLYALLSVDVDSSGNYADADSAASYSQATAALYYLQVTDDVCFYPNEPVRLGELLEMLAKFYPPSDSEYDIADVSRNNSGYPGYCLALEKGWVDLDQQGMLQPGRTITRLDACRLINKVLGRPGSSGDLSGLDGLIPDMSPADEGYSQIVEAAATHEYELSDGGESYGDLATFQKQKEGFKQVGTDLYYVDEDGMVLTSAYKGRLYFDSEGRYTSGDAKLDALVDEVLKKTIDSSMDALERLRAVYDYTVKSFEYQRRDALRNGSTDWETEQAYIMLSTGKGNCYSYAAAFCMLARAVGFDAQACAGTVDFVDSAHGWVEIEIDSVKYLFDPELEMTYLYNRGEKIDRFMFTPDNANGWTYDNNLG